MSLEESLAQHTLALNENTNVLRSLIERLQDATPEAPAKRGRKPAAEYAPALEEHAATSPKTEAAEPAATQAVSEAAPTPAPAEPEAASASPSNPVVDARAVKEAMNALFKLDGHGARAVAIAKKYGAAKLADIQEADFYAVVCDVELALATPEQAAA